MSEREMPVGQGKEHHTQGSMREANEDDMCDHTGPVTQEPTERDFRFRCVRCGGIGPERPNPKDAWGRAPKLLNRRERTAIYLPLFTRHTKAFRFTCR
jgi:hypothetical protein